MTIAVVGATGLVGRHIVEALSETGEKGVVASWHSRRPYEARNTSWVQCDLRESAGALAALQGADTAILCAGQLSTSATLQRDPTRSVLETLRIGTNLLEASSKLRVRRVILVSSCTVYPQLGRPALEADMMDGDPPAQWFGVGWMHRYLEQQLRWHLMRPGSIESAVSLRPTLIYGPYDDFSPESAHFVPAMIRKVVERASPIEIWGDGRQTRDLLHASDLAAAVLAVLEPREEKYDVFNVASREQVSVNDVVRHLVEIDRFSDATIRHLEQRDGGLNALAVSSNALMEATSWRPRVGIREGLAGTLAWFRRHHA
jgi:GDP-L-fucose synthase